MKTQQTNQPMFQINSKFFNYYLQHLATLPPTLGEAQEIYSTLKSRVSSIYPELNFSIFNSIQNQFVLVMSNLETSTSSVIYFNKLPHHTTSELISKLFSSIEDFYLQSLKHLS